MTVQFLYAIWVGLLALCALLGFIPEPGPMTSGLLTALAVLAFVPAAGIVVYSHKTGEKRHLRRLRNVAAASLGLTVAVLLVNFFTLTIPEWAGNLLYGLLVLVSTPMVCGQIWVVSLALWAVLLWTCILLLSRKK